jgi:hypothetical protein
MQDDVANRLARKLGLNQTPGKDVTKKFAERTRELQRRRGLTDDRAAIVAANEIFQSDLVLNRPRAPARVRCLSSSIPYRGSAPGNSSFDGQASGFTSLSDRVPVSGHLRCYDSREIRP